MIFSVTAYCVLCRVYAQAEVTVQHEGHDTMDSVCSVWDMQ